MQLVREVRDQTLIVRVSGDLDVFSAQEFRERIDAWFLASEQARLVLNLSRVAFLDSTGLGAVLGRLRRCQEAHREMAIIPPAGVAKSVLDVAALGRATAVFSSERAAFGEGAVAHG